MVGWVKDLFAALGYSNGEGAAVPVVPLDVLFELRVCGGVLLDALLEYLSR